MSRGGRRVCVVTSLTPRPGVRLKWLIIRAKRDRGGDTLTDAEVATEHSPGLSLAIPRLSGGSIPHGPTDEELCRSLFARPTSSRETRTYLINPKWGW